MTSINQHVNRARRERYEQADGVKLLQSLGAVVYVSGTVRRRGDYQGTMQTPGIPDVAAFLPPPKFAMPWPAGQLRRLVYWECKSATGRLSEPQREYQRLCQLSGVWHVVGDVNALLVFLVKEGYVRADQLTAQRQEAVDEAR